MNWYLAKMVFNIDIENGQHNKQFDEQLRMIQAESRDEAFFKARALGKREEVNFLNTKKKKIDWKFIDVSEINKLNEVNDGSQIYSSTHETKEANEYISFVKHKATVIQTESLVFI
jgi:Domain of unknown function (DUF4288)